MLCLCYTLHPQEYGFPSRIGKTQQATFSTGAPLAQSQLTDLSSTGGTNLPSLPRRAES